ncbi:MAG TPA: hypothetical protein VGG64_22130 [Pirellulales bacterium]|jgi:hypothetical protein
MSLQRIGGVLGVFVLVLGINTTAQAQWGFGGGFGYGGGFGWGGGGFANGAYTLEPPPYFSIFPPVYYSHVTPRPYGFSPFAYPGFAQTPERIGMQSTPYVPPRRQTVNRAASAQTVSKPVIIKNPYVLPEAERPERLADGRPVPQDVSNSKYASASSEGRIGLDR